jgi:hypothetical protein
LRITGGKKTGIIQANDSSGERPTRNKFTHNNQGTGREHLRAYWPPEAVDAINYIQNRFGKQVYVIGIRAIYDQGVPFYRGTEDVDIFAPLTIQQRDELGKYLRSKYKRIFEQWRGFGTSFKFPSGYQFDLNRANDYIEKYRDGSWDQSQIEIDGGTFIFVPPLEDLIILKLIANRKKDIRDVGHVLRTAPQRKSLDKDKLLERARRVGVERKLVRIAKISGLELSE